MPRATGGVMLQGWSDRASTALNAICRQATGAGSNPSARFRAALVLHPGCGP